MVGIDPVDPVDPVDSKDPAVEVVGKYAAVVSQIHALEDQLTPLKIEAGSLRAAHWQEQVAAQLPISIVTDKGTVTYTSVTVDGPRVEFLGEADFDLGPDYWPRGYINPPLNIKDGAANVIEAFESLTIQEHRDVELAVEEQVPDPFEVDPNGK